MMLMAECFIATGGVCNARGDGLIATGEACYVAGDGVIVAGEV